MRQSRWIKSFGWAIIGGILAPAALVSVLVSRSVRRRLSRLALVVFHGAARVREDLFGEFTLDEFVTGTVGRRPRR